MQQYFSHIHVHVCDGTEETWHEASRQYLFLDVCLKLVRTLLNVYFTAFKSSFLSLYAHINSDECHAWFHLNAASPAVRNAEQVNITKNSYPR